MKISGTSQIYVFINIAETRTSQIQINPQLGSAGHQSSTGKVINCKFRTLNLGMSRISIIQKNILPESAVVSALSRSSSFHTDEPAAVSL